MLCWPGVLALGGCMAAVDHRLVSLPTAGWWQAMNDPQLSLLIARGAPPPKVEWATEIARRYIELRAQQTALVLLARREDLDEQQATLVQRNGTPAAGYRSHMLRQLAATHRAQVRRRADIKRLRARLVRLTGSTPGGLDSVPGGPIPLPPARSANDPAGMIDTAVPRHARRALHRYERARQAAADAQARVEHAQALAATQALAARAGTVIPGGTIDSERRALDALQSEEHARAAMTQAYVDLAVAMGLGR